MSEATITNIISVVVALFGGGVIGVVIKAFIEKKKINAEANNTNIKGLLEIDQRMNERMAKLEERVANLEQENYKLKSEKLKLEKEAHTMSITIETLQKENETLREENQNLQNQINELNEKLETQKGEINNG